MWRTAYSQMKCMPVYLCHSYCAGWHGKRGKEPTQEMEITLMNILDASIPFG